MEPLDVASCLFVGPFSPLESSMKAQESGPKRDACSYALLICRPNHEMAAKADACKLATGPTCCPSSWASLQLEASDKANSNNQYH